MDVKLSIVGGGLQGIETIYLAKKAGYKTTLIDRKSTPPALHLADEFYRVDVLKEKDRVKKIFSSVDGVLPALEKVRELVTLEKVCRSMGLPYLQDNAAFVVTADKLRSAECLNKLGIPYPNFYPRAGFPLIVKPIHGSGSRDVYFVSDDSELRKAIKNFRGKRYLIQEFAPGGFLSLELLGFKGSPQPMQITWLEFDETYGCKRVLAPCPIEEEVERETITIGEKIVKGLKLTGLTDLQIVFQNEKVKVIEMNARFPSQTPTVVYHSTGLNLVELLFRLFSDRRLPSFKLEAKKAVIYQHIAVLGGRLKVVCEHFMCTPGLRLKQNFFGADEALTNFPEDGSVEGRVATIIVQNDNLSGAKKRMEEIIKSIMMEYKIRKLEDLSPPGVQSLYDKVNT